MRCIKCGREIPADQVFCGDCQENMEGYPVRPGTPIQLPPVTAQPAAKPKAARARKALPPEAQLRKARHTIRLLVLALLAALLAFLLMSCLSLYLLEQRDRQSEPAESIQAAAQSGMFHVKHPDLEHFCVSRETWY